MKAIVLFFTYYLIHVQITVNSSTDYYWRDYDGTIPCDAIQGGTDKYGHYTYIGQIAATDVCSPDLPDMVSATIYKGNPTAYAAYHSTAYKNNKNVKILCSGHHERYRWVGTYAKGCELVRGSFSGNYTNYYIGRANYKGRNVTGRFSTELRILFFPFENKQLDVKSYEMLTYCDEYELPEGNVQ